MLKMLKGMGLPTAAPVDSDARRRSAAQKLGNLVSLSQLGLEVLLVGYLSLEWVPDVFDGLRSSGFSSTRLVQTNVLGVVAAILLLDIAARVVSRLDFISRVVYRDWLSVGQSVATGPVGLRAKQERAGLRGIAQTILAVLARWNISDNQGAVILGLPGTDLLAALRSGEASLDTRDRAKLLFDIYEGVYGLLQDPQAERDWIRAPRTEFEGQSVLDLMTEGSQRNLIRALAFVDYVNGR
jgi:hypothetical protein